ncbi:MAG: NADPH:quinone reductase [Acidocella sp. 20-57-95]|nr:MAG: NADPH:quinone reductase [Acidocella sp. 20-57-95]OYV61021.1 MAG: NADPH:quinone reductase [Acidocella sp. 21-58-7]HQT65092.1 zinc-binding alcohol dehydrogenase family protein [Acidocella sp.]HQU04500.1 zinc-binding alcohol dehydrogenase family protein [Acidocella sp.]
MKAVAFTHSHPINHEDALIDIELPMPEPRRHDLLVEIKAVSVNPVDTKVRRHDEPLGETRVLGYDAAGIVRAVGPDVSHFGVGDDVYYAGVINRPGTNAEYHLVDERIVGRKPKTLSFAQAAALPLTSLTAWEMLFDRFKIPRDQTMQGNILIVGGAGGVGSMAVQLLSKLTDLTVIATASRPETVEWCKALGAHHVINHHHDMAKQIADLGLEAPDYVFCTTHEATHWNAIGHIVAPEGAIGIIESGKPLDFSVIMKKCVSVHPEYMFARALLQTKTMSGQHRILEAVAHLVDNGTLRTTMTEDYGLINAANLKRAHAALESHSVMGKIVLGGF